MSFEKEQKQEKLQESQEISGVTATFPAEAFKPACSCVKFVKGGAASSTLADILPQEAALMPDVLTAPPSQRPENEAVRRRPSTMEMKKKGSITRDKLYKGLHD